MNENVGHLEHEYFERLLPWFVNGTLGPGELKLVSEHVTGCEICELAVTELSMIQAGVQTPPATPIVPEPNVDRLMTNLDVQEARGPIGVPRWAIAASITALLLAVFTYYSGSDGLSQPPQRYETAISEQDVLGIDYVLAVSFVDGLGAAEQEEILRSLGATDISLAGPEGSYRVTMTIPAASMEELVQFTDELGEAAGVASVEVVALQLPVSRDP